jgi:serine/threonine-protein kinase
VIGKTISHYTIISKLGEGGMGVVYKAEDTKLDRTVALKFLPSHLCQDEASRTRFTREAKAAAKLDHSNIVPVYEVGEFQGRPFFAMAHIEGKSLREVIKEGKLTVSEAIDLTMQICDGLNEAHNTGVVHRDIKPGNVIIDRKNKARLLDFGLATVTGEKKLTMTGSTLGTVGYMSPEQVKGEKADHRSDLFSVGVLLYEMITGRLPFEAEHEAAAHYKIVNEVPEPLARYKSGLTGELQQIIDKALAKDSSLRYQHADDMRADLRRLKAVSGPAKKSRRGLWVAAALALIAVTYFGLTSLEDDSGAERSTDRVMLVVLPFANIGNESEQEYFADGMTEEMITILGNANPARLGVIARTSAMRYKRRDVTIEDIGHELGVGYILEGSVRRQGEQVRIAAKLINVEDQTQLWSKNFDGTMDDIFMLQSNVANQISEALAVELLQELHLTNGTHTPDPQAYEEYLAGRFFAHKGTEESWRKAIKFYEEAVRIDPKFALAYAALSHAYSVWSGWYTVTSKIAYDKAKEAADEAFRLNPNLADAHSALAVIAAYFEWNWQKADEQFRVALDLNPNDGETYHYYGHYLSFMDRDGESIEAFRNALKFDPLSAYHRNCMGIAYLKKEEIGQAESSIKKAQELEPESPLNYNYLGFLRERQGRLEEAILSWQKAVQYSDRLPTFLAVLGYGYGKSGQTDKAHEILKELELKSRNGHVAAMDISKVYAGLGDTDRAFAFLEEAYTNRESWIFGLKLDPGFDTIRDDPRFLNLLSRIDVEP